ncbi:hypothetical protein HG530_010653 [Fusarium avenaceum]|nr:hypothetical protein HG530_010653 [Fusarium avenaceum]
MSSRSEDVETLERLNVKIIRLQNKLAKRNDEYNALIEEVRQARERWMSREEERRYIQKMRMDSSLVNSASQGDAGDVVSFNLALELGSDVLNLDTVESQALGGFFPRLGENVGLGASSCEVGLDGRGAEEFDGDFDQFACFELNHIPCSVGGLEAVIDDNLVDSIDSFLASSLNHFVHVLGLVGGCLDNSLHHGQS